MSELTGSQIIAKALRAQGTEHMFYLMGGPMLQTENSCMREGIRAIDVRHEQAAAMAAMAYARLTQKPGVCMAASGPGAINLTTGLAHALIDCSPVVAIGGSSPSNLVGRQAFQEIDQVAIMKPVTKWAARAEHLDRIPELVNTAFQKAMSGKPGPVYLDFPADLLFETIEESKLDLGFARRPPLAARPQGDPARVAQLVDRLRSAKRPVVVSGSGVIWSRASAELQAFVERTGIPFFPTPQGRGCVPDDHELAFGTPRSLAFKEADLVLIVGTRMNYIIGHGVAPRFSKEATIARIDIDAEEIATAAREVEIGIVGDCREVLKQLLSSLDGKVDGKAYAEWRAHLKRHDDARKSEAAAEAYSSEPVHPIRLLREINAIAKRDAILCVDGQEILNYGRQVMPTFAPGHRINSGPFGTMGVGVPFGLGAKVAKPDKQVIVVTGDGAFGFNAMEIDTMVRHEVPVLLVISNNGGWSADWPKGKPGRDLGFTRYDVLAQSLGAYGEYVERVEDVGPALRRAQAQVDAGVTAVVNVKTDPAARCTTQQFTLSMT
ncbi:thiamine pyrophosphate-binding protein [Ramlibacter sp.]|uniref:thiamine pyrophosphate-binding protein n=1 Tax=Ramlibacter sp. TaxID=1917967 RepID=UPI003D1035EF